MIYKNNEPYKLSQAEVKLYSKNMVYLLMKHHYRYDPVDDRVRRPNTIMMEPFYTQFDPETGQSTEIRYAKTAPQRKNENGKTFDNWNPSEIEFPSTGSLVVPANDPEMNYFLAFHPMNDGNPRRDSSSPKSVFYAENRAEEARMRMKAQQKKFDAIALIFHEKDGMKEKDLRVVAKSFPDLVGSVDKWTVDQVKDALSEKATKDADFFLKACRSPETKMRHLVNEAIKEKVIRYAPSKKVWFVIENEVEKEAICTVRTGEDPYDKVISHLVNTDKAGHVQFLEKKLDREPIYEEQPSS